MDLPQPSLEELSRDRSPIVVGVVSMCLIVSTAILALRLWTRYYIVKKIGVDDYAAAFSLGLYVAAMVLVASSGIGVVVTCFVFCVPLDGFWDQRVPARCLSQQVIFYVFGAGTIVTDIVIFLLPLPALSKLQIPRSQRFYLLVPQDPAGLHLVERGSWSMVYRRTLGRNGVSLLTSPQNIGQPSAYYEDLPLEKRKQPQLRGTPIERAAFAKFQNNQSQHGEVFMCEA
ncbi:hypothetical protein ColKHC_09576 [Colletotrichum higginsianum]|nr:hypothetical protein ColKHC_09576 [Colletotrichum higginsianum]